MRRYIALLSQLLSLIGAAFIREIQDMFNKSCTYLSLLVQWKGR
jgi:hypothetical protein